MKKVVYVWSMVPLSIFGMDQIPHSNNHLLLWSQDYVKKHTADYLLRKENIIPPDLFPFTAQYNYALNFYKANGSDSLEAHHTEFYQAVLKEKNNKTFQAFIAETVPNLLSDQAGIEQDALGALCSPSLAKWFLYRKQYAKAMATDLIFQQHINNFFGTHRLTYNSCGEFPVGYGDNIRTQKGPVLTYNNESYPLCCPIESLNTAIKNLSVYEQALLESIRAELYLHHLEQNLEQKSDQYKQKLKQTEKTLKLYTKIASVSILSTITFAFTTLYFKFFRK